MNKFFLGTMLALTVSANVAAETRFLADMDDMPLAPGLQEIETERLVFDKAEGRILRTAASGVTTLAAVRDFYVATLPALGWRVTGTDTGYLMLDREHERLEIVIEGTMPVFVRFALQPRHQ